MEQRLSSSDFPDRMSLITHLISLLAPETDPYDITLLKRKRSRPLRAPSPLKAFPWKASPWKASSGKASPGKASLKTLKNRHKNCPKLFGRAFFRFLLKETSDFSLENLNEGNLRVQAMDSRIRYPEDYREKVSIGDFIGWLMDNKYHLIYSNLSFYREIWRFWEVSGVYKGRREGVNGISSRNNSDQGNRDIIRMAAKQMKGRWGDITDLVSRNNSVEDESEEEKTGEALITLNTPDFTSISLKNSSDEGLNTQETLNLGDPNANLTSILLQNNSDVGLGHPQENNWIIQHYKFFTTRLMQEFLEVWATYYVLSGKIKWENGIKYLKLIPTFLNGIEHPEDFHCLKPMINKLK